MFSKNLSVRVKQITVLSVVGIFLVVLLLLNNLPLTGLFSLTLNPAGSLGLGNAPAKGEYVEPTIPHLGNDAASSNITHKENNSTPQNSQSSNANTSYSGTSSSCDGSEVWGPWQLLHDCTSTQLCNAESHSCYEDPITCRTDSDCGENGWVGSTYCSGIDNNQVYQNYKTYKCNNPGTLSSYCTSSTTPSMQYDCRPQGKICYQGACSDSYSDLCSNYDSYWCDGTLLMLCRQDPNNGNHYGSFFISNCIGKTSCYVTPDASTGYCQDNKVTISFDYAGNETTVYKQAGDYFMLNLEAESSMSATFDYNTPYFEKISGICSKGTVNLPLGTTTCKFKVKENTPPSTYFFTLSHNGINTQRGLRITESPSMVILTNKQKLFERFPSEQQGVSSLLMSAYNYARANKAVVYDLSLYTFSAPHPFSTFSSYAETPTRLSLSPNNYVSEVSSFAKSKCPTGSCKYVLILGDDYVVPYKRELIGKTVLSDYTFVNSSSKPAGKNDNILQNSAIFIIPDNVSGELRLMISKAESEYAKKHFVMPVEMKSSQVKCDSAFFSSLGSFNVVLIGNKANNKAFTCNTYLEGSSIGNYSVRSNPWAIIKTSSYLITIKQNSLSEAEDALVYFYQRLDNPFFDSGAVEFIAACLGLKEETNLGDNVLNLACNVIPVVELGPDAVDTSRCVAEFVAQGMKYDSPVSELVCTVIGIASTYDLASYGGAALSAGSTLIPGEAVDVGISTIKVVLKEAAAPLAKTTLEPAIATLKASPELLGTMAMFVARRGDDAVDSSRAFIRLMQHGADIAKKGDEIITAALARGVKYSDDAVDGLGKLLKTKGLDYYDNVLKAYGDKFAEYFSRGVGKGVINPENIEVTKFVEVDNAYKAIGVDDVLEEGGAEQLEGLFKNTTHGGTKIGDTRVEGVTRLTKGNDSYGMDHIRRRHIQGIQKPGENVPTTFKEVYGIKDEKRVKELIEKSIVDGEPTIKGTRVEFTYTPPGTTDKMITVIENGPELYGEIVTAYPLR